MHDESQIPDERDAVLRVIKHILEEPAVTAAMTELQQHIDDYYPTLTRIVSPIRSQVVELGRLIEQLRPGLSDDELRSLIEKSTPRAYGFAFLLALRGDLGDTERTEPTVPYYPQEGSK